MRLRLGEYGLRYMVVVTVMALVGCGGGGDGPKTVPASGTVKYKGEPIKSGSLVFSPADAKTSRAAHAQIINGSYKTDPGQGLMVGDYKVVVQALKQENIAEFEAKGGAKKADALVALPKKYTDLKTTDLTVKVTDKDASVSKDFDLID